jgi:hypothetical protein
MGKVEGLNEEEQKKMQQMKSDESKGKEKKDGKKVSEILE